MVSHTATVPPNAASESRLKQVTATSKGRAANGIIAMANGSGYE
jgi:hypothetical protein